MKNRKLRGKRVLGLAIRVLGVSTLVLILLVPIYIAVTNHLGHRAAESVIREAAKLNALPQPPEDVPDEDNGSPLLRAAAFALSDPYDYEDNVPAVGGADWPRFGERFTEEQAAIVREMVDRNTTVFELVDRAAAKPHFQYDIEWRIFAWQDVMSILSETRSLTRWQEVRSLDAQARADTQTAVQAVTAAFAISRSLNAHDLLLTHMVQVSIDALTIEIIESMLSRLELEEPALHEMAQSLERSHEKLNFGDILRGEVAIMIPSISHPRWGWISGEYERARWFVHQSNVYNDLVRESGGEDTELMDLGDIMSHTSFWDFFSNALVGTYFTWVPGHQQLIGADGAKEVLDLLQQYESTKNQPRALIHLAENGPSDGPAEYLSHAISANLDIQTRLRVANTAMLVEGYRVSNGEWPASLQDLEGSIPTDEYGQPLRLQRTKRGVVVYSVGANGLDEKGVNASEDKTRGEEDDVTFELLKPDRRSVSPAPKEPE